MSCSDNKNKRKEAHSRFYLPGLPEAFELRPLCQQYKLPTACQWMRGTPELSVRIFQSPGQTGYSVQATFASSRPKQRRNRNESVQYLLVIVFLQSFCKANEDSRFYPHHLFIRQISQLPATHSALLIKMKIRIRKKSQHTELQDRSDVL